MRTLHKQLDEAVVFFNVSLEDLLAGAQDPFKTCTVEFHAFESALGFDGGRTRSLEQQSNLTCRVYRTQNTQTQNYVKGICIQFTEVCTQRHRHKHYCRKGDFNIHTQSRK